MSDQGNLVLSEKEAERLAKRATSEELRHHEWITPEEQERLVLGWGVTDGDYHFELYLAGERPLDAVLLTHTVVDGRTGAVTVAVNLPRKAGLSVGTGR